MRDGTVELPDEIVCGRRQQRRENCTKQRDRERRDNKKSGEMARKTNRRNRKQERERRKQREQAHLAVGNRLIGAVRLNAGRVEKHAEHKTPAHDVHV